MNKLLISIMICILTLTGCTNSKEKESNTSNNYEKAETTYTELTLKEDINILSVYNDNILYTKHLSEKVNSVDEEYYIYRIKHNTVSRIGEIHDVNISSADFQIMNDGIYMYKGIYENEKIVSKFVKLKDEKEVLDVDKDTNPLVYLNKLDDNTIIINGARLDEPSNTYEYYINSYNCTDKKITNIANSKYNMSEGNGNLLICVSAQKSKLYVYKQNVVDRKVEYMIDVYEDNKVIESIKLADFKNYLVDGHGEMESVFNFKVIGDYFYFYTLNGKSLLFKYTNDKIETIDLGRENRLELLDIYNENIGDILNDRIYLIDRVAEKIYYFSLESHELVQIPIDMNLDYRLKNCIVDDRGNLVIKYSNDKDFKYLLIESKDVK